MDSRADGVLVQRLVYQPPRITVCRAVFSSFLRKARAQTCPYEIILPFILLECKKKKLFTQEILKKKKKKKKKKKEPILSKQRRRSWQGSSRKAVAFQTETPYAFNVKVSKVGNRSRGRPEGSFFNSYYSFLRIAPLYL